MRPKNLSAGHQSICVQKSQTPRDEYESCTTTNAAQQAETAGRTSQENEYVCARAARVVNQRHPRSMISLYI